MSIYRTVTKSDSLPPRFGPQWEVIGFQGNDPATDLRGAGVLALLQMLHLAGRRPKLVESVFATSASGTAFPMMVVSINLTQISLQALRGGAITKEANRAPPTKGKQGYEPVYETFHSGTPLASSTWFASGSARRLGIQDFGNLRKEIETLALKKPAKLLAALKEYDAGPAQGLVTKGGPVSFG